MPSFGPVASGPVCADPDVIYGDIFVAGQSAAIGILSTPSISVASQSAAIAILVSPEPPTSGRRRQYYII